MWELRLVPHEVSLGLWGRVWGGGRGVPILDGFCSCPAGHGRFSGVGFWVVFGQDSRSPFWVSFGRFSGAFQEAHEGIWGLFWACLELIVGRRTSVPRPVHCRAFVPARGSQVWQNCCETAAFVRCRPACLTLRTTDTLRHLVKVVSADMFRQA